MLPHICCHPSPPQIPLPPTPTPPTSLQGKDAALSGRRVEGEVWRCLSCDANPCAPGGPAATHQGHAYNSPPREPGSPSASGAPTSPSPGGAASPSPSPSPTQTSRPATANSPLGAGAGMPGLGMPRMGTGSRPGTAQGSAKWGSKRPGSSGSSGGGPGSSALIAPSSPHLGPLPHPVTQEAFLVSNPYPPPSFMSPRRDILDEQLRVLAVVAEGTPTPLVVVQGSRPGTGRAGGGGAQQRLMSARPGGPGPAAGAAGFAGMGEPHLLPAIPKNRAQSSK